MYQDETLYFQGRSIHFSTARPKERAEGCALLIAGPGETGESWKRIVPELLKANIFCVSSELPGLGLGGGDSSNETRAGFLWGVLDELDKRAGRVRTWHVIAHGSACATALLMALEQPESVASLVLIAPVLEAPVGKIMYNLLMSKYGRNIAAGWYHRNVGNARNFAELAEKAYGMRPTPAMLRRLRAPLMRRGIANSIVPFLRESYRLPEKAYSPQCPTMVLFGENDRYAQFGQTEITGAEVYTLQYAAHCPAETNASAVCDYLRGWYRTFL